MLRNYWNRADPLPEYRRDPKLDKPTRCRVLRAFMHKGRPVEIGTTITLPWATALELSNVGKVQIIE